jgi:Leucine-rich repeat (LRR) protein
VDRAPNMTILDLHSNKLQVLPDSVCTLYKLKSLKISNNDLSDINPKISLIDSLDRMNIEGNPLRKFKPSMRNTTAGELKKYLKSRLGEDTIAKEEHR